MKVTILGREPAALVALIETLLAVLISFGLFGLDNEKAGLIVAVVSAVLGIYTAYVTHDTLLSAIVAATKALLALGVGYGLELTTQQTGLLIALVTAALGLFLRTQTSPLSHGSFSTGLSATEVPVVQTVQPVLTAQDRDTLPFE